MNMNYQFVASLFHKAEQTVEQVNNLQVNAYRVRVDGTVASIEAVCMNEYGTIYGTKDVRTIVPTKKQLDRLQKLGGSFFVYED